MEASRAYRLRLLGSLVGVFVIAVGASGPWIKSDPGFVTGVHFPIVATTHAIGELVFWGALVVGGFLLVEVAAWKSGLIDDFLLNRWIVRTLGTIALGLALLTISQLPPFGPDLSWDVTTEVYLVAIGGILLIGSSFTHRFLSNVRVPPTPDTEGE
jgi:hypothetical protein